MLKKITTILVTISLISSMYNYVFAKYMEKQQIHIAEVNVENIRKSYSFEVRYIDIEKGSTIRKRIRMLYEGEKYNVEILNLAGYTYLYTDKELSGIIEENIIIRCYYQKNN